MPLAPPPQLLQTIFTEITSDVSATPTAFSYVTLLSQSITTTGYSYVEAHFSGSTSNNYFIDSASSFRITLDGSPVMVESLCRYITTTFVQSSSLRYRTGILSAGSHTITVDWTRDSGTLFCRPDSVPEEHASLLLKELTV